MLKKLSLALVMAGLIGGAHAATDADVENTFYPYKKGFPSFPGLKAGMTITKDNVEQFKDALAAGTYLMIKNGYTTITVGETTDFKLPEEYIKATKANLNKSQLGAAVGDNIVGFEAGRPFPEEPDLKDPRAGEKLAWNYKYGLNWGDNAIINPLIFKYRNMETGEVERTLRNKFHFLNFKHRIRDEPVPEVTPNPSNLFRAIYMEVEGPEDLKGTKLLIQRYDDDAKLDDAYLYLGFQRRVRRLATGQVTDAFLGSDLMIEDFEGYNGRVADMKWTYKGTRNVLLPMWNHNESPLSDEIPADSDGYKYIKFGGKGGCFLQAPWQLRKAYVLEAEPVNPNHPISKRVFYMDAQLQNVNGAIEIYDRKGELWKVWSVGKSQPEHHLAINKGSGVGIDDGFQMVDIQSNHCTSRHFRGEIAPNETPPQKFQVQYMRGSD